MISSRPATYRQADTDDIGPIFDVRTCVQENRLDRAELRDLGISEQSVALSLADDHRAWVAEIDHRVVGFSMASSIDGRIFALFVRPEYERLGIGRQLLGLALKWLRTIGLTDAWLTTDPQSRAAVFYERQGWSTDHQPENGDIRFECKLGDEPV
jgi:GNAT superfamily N-acetyltransferase